ncbi:response regulator transcription factor [Nocardioides sp.]|uniref:response regulator transcription factor n=1 Tax=Nocardioides sp. TaxID=35761 RepID=UPI00286BBB29|nr:response regulator transcription factor [Nocardioides sp.]
MTSAHRAVIVDDDDDIRDLLVHVLEGAGLEVSTASDGVSALQLIRDVQPDLVTLDLSLPDMDGTDVCRALREFSDAYVVMITGRDAEIDRLVGLEVGADDYMAKPFSPREVRARVSALLRRPRLGAVAVSAPVPDDDPTTTPAASKPRGPVDVGGGLVLDAAHHVAVLDGERVMLTPAEFDLLNALASRPGTGWERGDLVREVWQGEFIESDFLVDVHIGNVRRKLRRAGSDHNWIRTIDGSGYIFEVA